MTLLPLLQASPVIQLHVASVVAAVALLVPQLALRKGTATHRAIGWAWVAAMTTAALSALFIHTIRSWGPFSPIHLLVPLTLAGLARGVVLARRHDGRGHRRMMLRVAVVALGVAGAFTLLPGRLMHAVFWPS